MSFTVEDVLNASLVDLNEIDFTWADRDDGFVRWLNDGLLDICQMAKCYIEEQTIDLVQGEREYNLNSDFISAKRVSVGDNRVWPRDRNLNDIMGAVGDPFTYTVARQNTDAPLIRISKEPPDPSNDMLVEYAAEHPEVTEDFDDIHLPRQFKSHLIDYVNTRFNYMDREPRSRQQAMQSWREGLEQSIRRMNRESTNGGRAVPKGRIQAKKRRQNY